MSIYRDHRRRPYGLPVVDPLKPSQGAESPREPAPTAPPCAAAEARLRRQAPNDIPLGATFKWIAKLPPSVQPIALLRRFPRIANALAGAWNDRDAFRAHMYALLSDRRGGRKGFPTEILGELLALRLYYENLNPAILDVYRETGKRN